MGSALNVQCSMLGEWKSMIVGSREQWRYGRIEYMADMDCPIKLALP